ncbi:methyltransferase [Streptomyces sp. OE57]|uniref:methyltransferase n=1 Tax=Streptomyces lacaronensis TaxID=3379885 RepID=UPI0039B73831
MTTDPTALYRLRDSAYAPDLLIVAVAELDLFSWLDGHGPASAEHLCSALDLDPRAVDVMLTYLVALGLLERAGDEVRVTAASRDHLTAGSPYDLRPYYASLAERPGCAELLRVLRTGEPASWASAAADADWESRLADPAFAAGVTAAMDARGRFLGPALAEALADVPMRQVLDVGGGSGIYAGALADRFPALDVAVLERAPVDVATRALLNDRGHASRVDVLVGDMFGGALPDGFDLHLYSHVLHDWGAGRVRQLLSASYAALPAGGYLVDHDVHINADKSGPLPAAEYSVFLMHATPGKCWSVRELADMLGEAGFEAPSLRPTAGDRSVVIARKPG